MKALGNPRITMKMWKKWYFVFNHRHRTTCEALANFKRGDKKRARREGRAEVRAGLYDSGTDLQDMTIDQLRALAASMPELSPDLATELHFRLWDWLVHNAHRLSMKQDWPGWDTTQITPTSGRFGGHKICNACFLCYMDLRWNGNCNVCPMHLLSLKYDLVYCKAYHHWLDACLDRNVSLAAFWATRIRDCVKRG